MVLEKILVLMSFVINSIIKGRFVGRTLFGFIGLACILSTPLIGETKVHNDTMLLTVDKTKLEAVLQTWPEDRSGAKVLKKFRIATGKEEGDKQKEGDNRTPEGVYFAQMHINGSKLPAKYGSMAIPIDFPNPIDRVEKKTGYGIWLHGVDNAKRIEEAKVTEGCVAFYNEDVAKLGAWLKPRQGLVVIADELASVNRPEEVSEVKRLTQSWIDAWANRSINDYIGHYHKSFRYKGQDLPTYTSYKRNVFSGYKKMVVSYDHLRVVTHPKYAVSMFNQDFYGDKRFKSLGRKILYWIKDADGNWKIRREIFENRRFEFLTYTDKELAMLNGRSFSEGSQRSASKL